jgi:hypothetical protein
MLMAAFFRYSSRNKPAIEDLTRTLEGAYAGFGLKYAEALRLPVLSMSGSGRPTRMNGATPR